MLRTILKESETIRWELCTFKLDGRPTLVTSLTRWTRTVRDSGLAGYGAWSFGLTEDSWQIARVPCKRATKKELEAAHEAAKPLAMLRVEAKEGV